MKEIKKIKGYPLADVKARQSINYLNNVYKNLTVNNGKHGITEFDTFIERQSQSTGKMEKYVSVTIDDLNPGIYKCPDNTKRLKVNIKSGKSTEVIQIFEDCSSMLVYVISKDLEKIIYTIDNKVYTCYFTDTSGDYTLTSKLIYLTCDNDIEFTPTEDYHPVTKKYVDDRMSNSSVDALITYNEEDESLKILESHVTYDEDNENIIIQ